MIGYSEGDILISGADAKFFMENALHPDRIIVERRDAFFRELDTRLSIEYANDVMTVDISDLILPDLDSLNKASKQFEIIANTQYSLQKQKVYTQLGSNLKSINLNTDNLIKENQSKKKLKYPLSPHFISKVFEKELPPCA